MSVPALVPDPAGPDSSTQTELELDVATPRPPRGRRRPGPVGRRAARRAQRAPARGRRPRGRAAARRRRRRLGQDPGADPPDRLADLRAQRPPRLDPGDHLHQQGRRRDARAGRGAGRPPGPDHVGLARSTPPACGSCARRSTRFGYKSTLLDLRRRRLQAADDAGLPRPRPRREALPAAGGPQLGLQRRRTSCIDHEDAAQGRPERPRGDLRRGLRASTSSGCAQANALDFDDLIMTTVHLFQAFPEVRETYRRRFRHVLVDEYQDTNHAQYALIRELCAHDVGAGPATDPDAPDGDGDRAGGADGGRRRRPVDLRVPRRQHPQHPGVRGGLPRRHARSCSSRTTAPPRPS